MPMWAAQRAPLPGGRWHLQHGPIDLVVSPYGNAALMISGYGNAVFPVAYDPGAAAPFTIVALLPSHCCRFLGRAFMR